MKTKNIPINKGNYSMDTPEREALFEQYRGEGWESEYQAYRANWVKFARDQHVADYPLLVDLELASLCNLKCPMCYTITEEFKAKVNAKTMDYELFKKIIDEIAGKVPAIRLSLRGEATLHPKFIDAIAYAKSRGIREISTLTNGSKLKREYFQKMVEAGIDWITISIDGTGEMYERIRKPIKFANILQIVKDIHAFKQEKGLHRPVIKVQSIWPAIKDDPQGYYDTFAPYVDLVAYNPLIDYLSKDSDVLYEDDFACPQHYQRLVVGADGRVMMCSNDEENREVIGDAYQETIQQIWQGERLERIRAMHRDPAGFLQVPVCRKCYIPRQTDDRETAEVAGRSFTVFNYVNRSQVIGT